MNITFTFKGTEYSGNFYRVQGAGDTGVYHLMVNNYYRGRLRLSAFNNQWAFDGEFAELAEGYGTFMQMLFWIKKELQEDEKGLFYYLADTHEFSETL